MKSLFIIVCLIISLISCIALKPIARTITDAATILCELTAAENTVKLDGMTPSQWCNIYENIVPFIDPLLEAKKSGASKSGLSK